MYKLINDLVQYSDAPGTIKSPSLADIYEDTTIPVITLDATYDVDCIGIGNTDATEIIVNGETITLGTGQDKNGLYLLTTPLNTNTITITYDGTYIGRIGIGKYDYLGSSYTRTTGHYSTEQPRDTAGGQVIPGAGGITGRTVGINFDSTINESNISSFNNAYASQISKGFPFFINFDKETVRQPVNRFYGKTDIELLFSSDLLRYQYSITLDYREAF